MWRMRGWNGVLDACETHAWRVRARRLGTVAWMKSKFCSHGPENGTYSREDELGLPGIRYRVRETRKAED